MNKEIKTKWVEALRSGTYKQGKGTLRKDDTFCCLGVLCDLHSREFNIDWLENSLDFETDLPKKYIYLSYLSCVDYLPDEIKTWANLDYRDPEIQIVDHGTRRISALNDDDRLSFENIADLIEAQL